MSQTALHKSQDDPPHAPARPSSDVCETIVNEMFNHLNPEDVRSFVEVGRLQFVDADEVLVSPEQAPEGLTIIVTGEMRIEQDGQKIRDFGRACYFGEGSLVRDAAPGVTITATDPSWVLIFPKDVCRSFIDQHARFGVSLMKNVLAETMNRLGDTNILFASNKSLAEKLRATLGKLSKEVNERKQSEERARYLATHDSLTGLANRVMLAERMDVAISQALRRDTRFAALLIDLDGFKEVNDVHGHPVGDVVLKVMAERLQECVRAADTVARLGGDEFAILQDLAEVADPRKQSFGLGSLADRLLASIQKPIEHDNATLHLGGSIGIAVFPTDGDKSDTLMRNADLAMYRAKRDGKGQYRFFTSEIGKEVVRSNYIKSDLRRALENEELEVYYQPKADLRNGQIIGMEALIRWEDPNGGLVSPSEFIPLAESCGLIMPIGQWILEESCRQTKQWHDQGLAMLKVAVNLSPVQFRHNDVRQIVDDALAKSGLPPAFLEVEITEGVLLNDAKRVTETLRAIRAMGVSIAVDDFGTGYSSMSYLKKLSATTVKIDKAFVQESHRDPEDLSICQAIIGLAHSLGMSVVAEGVTEQAQLDLLRKFRCDQVQGYLISRPMSRAKFEDFVNSCLVREVRAVVPQVGEAARIV